MDALNENGNRSKESGYDWWGVAKEVYKETCRHNKVEAEENSDEKNVTIKEYYEKIMRFGELPFKKREFNIKDYDIESVGNFFAYYFDIKENLVIKIGDKSNRGLEYDIIEEQDINFEVISMLMLLSLGNSTNRAHNMQIFHSYTEEWRTSVVALNFNKYMLLKSGINKQDELDIFFNNEILESLMIKSTLDIERSYMFFRIRYCQFYSIILDYQIKSFASLYWMPHKVYPLFLSDMLSSVNLIYREEKNKGNYKKNIFEEFAVMNAIKMLRKQNELVLNVLEIINTNKEMYEKIDYDGKIDYKKVSDYNDKELGMLLNGGKKDSRMKERRETVLKVINWLGDRGEWYFEKDDFRNFKIVYEEIFKDKNKYGDLKASIVAKRLDIWNNRSQFKEAIFLREKIFKGFIVEYYSYKEYIKMCGVLRNWNLLLKELYKNSDLDVIISGYEKLNDLIKFSV